MDLYNYEEYNIADMISDSGYILETHKSIQTKDGYILTLHRIPHPKNGNFSSNIKRHPILLMHGMLGCTGHYLMQGPNASLPYVLAEAGYDVWMGNVRGVIYSRDHVKLDYSKDYDYWHFSMHEMGVYDLPAMIDYILETTQSPQLHYVGFSQGCVIFFIMASELPGYVSKISLFVGLSPVVYVKGATHPWLPIVAKFQTPLRFFTSRLGLCSVRFGFLRKYQHYITSHSWCQSLLKFMMHGTFGTQQYKITNDRLEVTVKYFQGINYHSLYHAMQIHNKAKFVQYDYGTAKNLEVYGTETVREYRVENATCPVALFYSEQDWLMPAENALLLASELSNVLCTYKVESEDFSHFDFLIAEEAVEKVYKPIVTIMHGLDNVKV